MISTERNALIDRVPMSFFRYPGGKKKLKDQIFEKIDERFHKGMVYIEPFFGAGSIGLHVAKSLKPKLFWINDFNIGIYCIWKSLFSYQDELISRVKEYMPKVEDFYSFKHDLKSTFTCPKTKEGIVDLALKKIAIHQMSFSGLGTMSGGPLGGAKQTSKYKIDCRWSPDYMIKKIKKYRLDFEGSTTHVSCFDFSECFNIGHCEAVMYLDPPYFEKGNDLYQDCFSIEDHEKLRDCLKGVSCQWVLSYDDCKEIREMYSWANIDVVEASYTIKGSRKKKELIITR